MLPLLYQLPLVDLLSQRTLSLVKTRKEVFLGLHVRIKVLLDGI